MTGGSVPQEAQGIPIARGAQHVRLLRSYETSPSSGPTHLNASDASSQYLKSMEISSYMFWFTWEGEQGGCF